MHLTKIKHWSDHGPMQHRCHDPTVSFARLRRVPRSSRYGGGYARCGKWVGAARAGFDGIVVDQNQTLVDKPELLTKDPFGEGWMLVVRPSRDNWRDQLVSGDRVSAAIEAWIASGSYKDRAG